MYYANCEWYVDMGEHNKPLCKRNSLRPAKCSECPVYIRSIEAENAKLRELARTLINCADSISAEDVYYKRDVDGCGFDCTVNGENCSFAKMCDRARELGVELGE